MAGKYVTILRPGYSLLYPVDLPYTPGSGEDAALNPFNPHSARPLVEGEFLEFVGSGNSTKLTRGGNNAVSSPGTPDGEGTNPAFLYFMEEGRYDAQIARMGSVIMGPGLFEFRTKLCYSGSLQVNDKVSVWDWDGSSGSWGVVRRVLAEYSAGWSVGRVTRIFGTNDIGVLFGMA